MGLQARKPRSSILSNALIPASRKQNTWNGFRSGSIRRSNCGEDARTNHLISSSWSSRSDLNIASGSVRNRPNCVAIPSCIPTKHIENSPSGFRTASEKKLISPPSRVSAFPCYTLFYSCRQLSPATSIHSYLPLSMIIAGQSFLRG